MGPALWLRCLRGLHGSRGHRRLRGLRGVRRLHGHRGPQWVRRLHGARGGFGAPGGSSVIYPPGGPAGAADSTGPAFIAGSTGSAGRSISSLRRLRACRGPQGVRGLPSPRPCGRRRPQLSGHRRLPPILPRLQGPSRPVRDDRGACPLLRGGPADACPLQRPPALWLSSHLLLFVKREMFEEAGGAHPQRPCPFRDGQAVPGFRLAACLARRPQPVRPGRHRGRRLVA